MAKLSIARPSLEQTYGRFLEMPDSLLIRASTEGIHDSFGPLLEGG